jgi:hypothetical protein
MAFEEDLSLFLSADEFAVPAQAVTRHSEVVQFQVIFDNGYTGGLVDRFESAQPQAQARSADVADLTHGCAFSVNGVDYLVAGLQPDGTGMTTVLLELAS